jgi:hypothetical protein
VYVAGAAGAVIVCAAAPPSDQDENVHPACGEMASTALSEPTITVREKGVVEVEVPTVSCSPCGTLWKERLVVCGWMLTDAVCWRPWLSVAVSRISR